MLRYSSESSCRQCRNNHSQVLFERRWCCQRFLRTITLLPHTKTTSQSDESPSRVLVWQKRETQDTQMSEGWGAGAWKQATLAVQMKSNLVLDAELTHRWPCRSMQRPGWLVYTLDATTCTRYLSMPRQIEPDNDQNTAPPLSNSQATQSTNHLWHALAKTPTWWLNHLDRLVIIKTAHTSTGQFLKDDRLRIDMAKSNCRLRRESSALTEICEDRKAWWRIKKTVSSGRCHRGWLSPPETQLLHPRQLDLTASTYCLESTNRKRDFGWLGRASCNSTTFICFRYITPWKSAEKLEALVERSHQRARSRHLSAGGDVSDLVFTRHLLVRHWMYAINSANKYSETFANTIHCGVNSSWFVDTFLDVAATFMVWKVSMDQPCHYFVARAAGRSRELQHFNSSTLKEVSLYRNLVFP